MAKFNIKAVKSMPARNGARYSTDYYQQSQEDYDRTWRWMSRIMEDLVQGAIDEDLEAEMDAPLKGFPRSGSEPNYSAHDIFLDLCKQYRSGKDWPSGMIGRWNRYFKDYPEYQVEFERMGNLPKNMPVPWPVGMFE